MYWHGLVIFLLPFSVISAKFPPERNCNNTQFECDDGECIDKKYWCNRYNRPGQQCKDRSESINCGQYYPKCHHNHSYCTENRKCIPVMWSCDGYKDCPSGSDEEECFSGGYRIRDIPGVESGRRRAKSWLLGMRHNWRWKKETPRAIVALYLSNFTEFSEGNLTSELMVKELRLQVAESLLRNQSQPLPAHQVAMFIHALLATCQNPRNFFGFNLVDELHKIIKTSASPNPFVALALCNANETLPTEEVVQLLKLTLHTVKPERLDSHALSSMALGCLQKRNKTLLEWASSAIRNKRSHSDMVRFIGFGKFDGLQMEDGSFGSVYSTALVLQALLVTQQERTNTNIAEGIGYLISEQKENGAFNDIMSTYLVLPLLYGKTLADLGNVNCSNNISNITVQEELEMKNTKKQTVGYSIWVGMEKDVAFSMHMRVPLNISFFDVMRLAAELDPRYRFGYVSYHWGKYMYSIFGIVNDPEAGKYWQLHRLIENEQIYIDKTPDKVFAKHNEEYVYWYKPTVI